MVRGKKEEEKRNVRGMEKKEGSISWYSAKLVVASKEGDQVINTNENWKNETSQGEL